MTSLKFELDNNEDMEFLSGMINQIIEEKSTTYNRLLPAIDLSNKVYGDEYTAVGINTVNDLFKVLIEDDLNRAIRLQIEKCNLSKEGFNNLSEIISENLGITIEIQEEVQPGFKNIIKYIENNMNETLDARLIAQRISNYLSWQDYSNMFVNLMINPDGRELNKEFPINICNKICGLEITIPEYFDAISKDYIDEMFDVLDTLSENESRIIKNIYMYGYSYNEIARNQIPKVGVRNFIVSHYYPSNNLDELCEIIYEPFTDAIENQVRFIERKGLRKLRHPYRSKRFRYYHEILNPDSVLGKAFAAMHEVKPGSSKKEILSYYLLGGFESLDSMELAIKLQCLYMPDWSIDIDKVETNDIDALFRFVSMSASCDIHWYKLPEYVDIPETIKNCFPNDNAFSNEDILITLLGKERTILILVKTKSEGEQQIYKLFRLLVGGENTCSTLGESFNSIISDSLNLRSIKQVKIDEAVLKYLYNAINVLNNSDELEVVSADNSEEVSSKDYCDDIIYISREILKFELSNENGKHDTENQEYILGVLNEIEIPDRREVVGNMPIEELELSVRSYNVLKRAGVETVDDLAAKKICDLMKVRNMGEKSLIEIQDKLREYNIFLEEE